ncbi:NAD(P)/FAD-dependent oxidoreductase [Noviherbaspirillum autotrophicum]|uniref:FAD-dependent oxidoreductase n=1 Tax=Noviherbaspirillum autotrophicum TaxID=709839 RepID=A0A0C1Y7G7_9BURK|nr:FAD-binding oxidoreductase [Noviherbaspirillum autotrophicum]KIF82838.1 FAD-dependent oxidoreductase [Noviherbaspirillum autotrophicum]
MNSLKADFLVIGAGIAGASIAYWLSRHAQVMVLERESHAGYHSTGRSAALYMASYGPPQVRALTCASRAFFDAPPAGFCAHPLLTPRGALAFAREGQEAELEAHEAVVRQVSAVDRLDKEETLACIPVLKPDGLVGAVLEKDAADIDVDALLQGFLRGARANGSTVACDMQVQGLRRYDGQWQVSTNHGVISAKVIVNAAGAWADEIGRLAGTRPIGLTPMRRSAMLFAPPEGIAADRWPLLMDIGHSFYVKPDAGLLLGSPFNADPVEPHDVQAEELDIAIAIDTIQTQTTMTVRRPRHVWAGLRSFVADGELVGGYDPDVPGFFWAAGQGGYGIQTAPAAGMLYASLVRGEPVPDTVAAFHVNLEALSPKRLR